MEPIKLFKAITTKSRKNDYTLRFNNNFTTVQVGVPIRSPLQDPSTW